MLKIKFKTPTIFLLFRGIYKIISKLTYHKTLSLWIYPFVVFLTSSKAFWHFYTFFLSTNTVFDLFGAFYRLKVFMPILLILEGNFGWSCVPHETLPKVFENNVCKTGKLFNHVLLQLSYNFLKICPWLANNNIELSTKLKLNRNSHNNNNYNI